MIALVRAELAKLGGSLALLFALVVPALTALLAVLALVTDMQESRWLTIIDRLVLPLWVMFLLPMATAAFCTLVAQIEYRAKAWDTVLSQPFPRWQVFAAKLVVVSLAIAGMTVLTFAYAYVLVGGVSAALGILPQGPLGLDELGMKVPRLLGAAFFLVVLQLWSALRFGNFVIPLAVGIGGTLVGLAVLITGTDKAGWFPWVLTLASVRPESGLWPVWLGIGGGVCAALAMLADLGRRAMR